MPTSPSASKIGLTALK